MRRKRTFIISLLVVLGVLLWWWQRPSPPLIDQKTSATPTPLSQQISSSPQSLAAAPQVTKNQAASRKEAVGKILSMLATPITFYGKVIDEKGNPVPNAKVGYSALDKFMAEGTGYTGTSDQNGNFSISGIKGARLSVNVRKEGYYFIDEKSNAAFAYGTGSDGYFKNPPTKENPAVFVLQKMGTAEPLIVAKSRQIKIPKTGQPVNVDLATVRVGSGGLQITSWVNDNSHERYDWRYQLSIPGGGLIERKGQFDFEAPVDGYQASTEIHMSTSAESWSDRAKKQYFAKLPDGRYARFLIKIYSGEPNVVLLESYVNPTSGSRNLEFDPKEVIKAP